jgi:NAD(P)-dependent dehydrogenase (short-subunit alcohol dehydrogenase family)
MTQQAGPQQTGRLAGKVAVITGATGGIGRAAARRFAAEGARLLLVDLDKAALRGMAGPDIATLALDVAADDAAERYVAEATARFGGVDVALLNAGIEGEVAPIGKGSLAMFDCVMAVNLRAVWLGLSALMPAMQAQGGSIVITSSTAGLKGTPSLAPYGASKHGVVGLMKSAAIEGAAHRIRVNTVNPGMIDTRMIAAIMQGRNPADAEAARAAGIARIPTGRYGQPDEVAALMLFLASDEASFCTDTAYAVDGGTMAG